ncbi:MAG: GNAT family N-acetyltransferase [Maribacter sp.]
MELIYKACTSEDLKQLAEVSKQTFTEAFEKDNDPEDFRSYVETAFAEKTLALELANLDCFFYFVFFNEVLVAYFKLNRGNAQTDLKYATSIELERIYVLSEYQGMGLGNHIVHKIKEISGQFDKELLWLGVWEKNEGAIRFYERHGFYKFGTHPYFIGTDEQTDWLMRYDLIQ